MIILRQKYYSWLFGNKKPKKKEISNEVSFSDLSRQHGIIYKIVENINKNTPNVNLEGDEFPWLIIHDDPEDIRFGEIDLGDNESFERYKWDGKNWIDYWRPNPKIVPNLKIELIGRLENYRKEYKENPYNWSTKDIQEVLKFIDNQIKEIKRSNL